MADIILIDPLGRRITFHDRTWYGHILRRHPEMNGWRAQIGQTVQQPKEIRVSTYDPDCRTCYSKVVRAGMMIAFVITF